MKFCKAPKYKGKYLSINVGGGDRRVEDNDVLEGPQYARFVQYGWLVQMKEADAPEATPEAAPAPKVTEKAPEKATEAKDEADAPDADAEAAAAAAAPDGGSISKSPAGKRRSKRRGSTEG